VANRRRPGGRKNSRPNPVSTHLLLEEVVKRANNETKEVYASIIENLMGPDLFVEQRKFVNDSCRRKALLSGRRAGKTRSLFNLIAAKALSAPNQNIIYVNGTRGECKRVAWLGEKADNPGLPAFFRNMGIETRTNETELTIVLPNGSRIELIGCSDRVEIDKLRGGAYDLVVVDEAGKMPNLDYLVIQVVQPAMLDYQGTLCLAGTPNPQCTGLFYEVTNDINPLPGWSVHYWTAEVNTKAPPGENGETLWERITEDRLAQRIEANDPAWLREYKAQWIASTDAFVFKINVLPEVPLDAETKKPLPEYLYSLDHYQRYYDGNLDPDLEWEYVIGVDLGHDPDPFAVSVWAYSENSPMAFECHAWKKVGLITDQQAAVLHELLARFSPARIIMDEGGQGKQIAADLRIKYGLPIEAATKGSKTANLFSLNNDIVAGRLRFLEDSLLVEEMLGLRWNESLLARGTHKEKDGDDNHLTDACLYAWRALLHPFWEQKEIKPLRGSKARDELEQQRMEDDMYTNLFRRQRGEDFTFLN